MISKWKKERLGGFLWIPELIFDILPNRTWNAYLYSFYLIKVDLIK